MFYFSNINIYKQISIKLIMEQDETDEDIISELPEYSPKSEFSKARVVEQSVTYCFQARATEMKEGYYNTLLSKDGMPIRKWISDTREKYFGAVHALMSLLNPEIQRDKETKKVVEDFKNKCEEIREQYLYEELILDCSDEKRLIYKKTGMRFIPPTDAKVIIGKFNSQQKKIFYEEVVGGWNEKLNRYKDELVPIYDLVFSELNTLIDKLNYFKMSAQF
jgi:hypothetical protein